MRTDGRTTKKVFIWKNPSPCINRLKFAFPHVRSRNAARVIHPLGSSLRTFFLFRPTVHWESRSPSIALVFICTCFVVFASETVAMASTSFIVPTRDVASLHSGSPTRRLGLNVATQSRVILRSNTPTRLTIVVCRHTPPFIATLSCCCPCL